MSRENYMCSNSGRDQYRNTITLPAFPSVEGYRPEASRAEQYIMAPGPPHKHPHPTPSPPTPPTPPPTPPPVPPPHSGLASSHGKGIGPCCRSSNYLYLDTTWSMQNPYSL